jgi:hypothetical protein
MRFEEDKVANNATISRYYKHLTVFRFI